jgi:hypothetical protein
MLSGGVSEVGMDAGGMRDSTAIIAYLEYPSLTVRID